MQRDVEKLKALLRTRPATLPLLEQLRADPSAILVKAGMTPDLWQTTLLRSSSPRTLLLCSRQVGKSFTAAALALREAMLRPRSLVLLLAPTLRQSGELFGKLMELYRVLHRPVAPAAESVGDLQLVNGSRVLALPGQERTIRGFSGVRLLVVDEAARVPDELYYAVRPMLAVSCGGLVALSTPFGKRGWFYEAWTEGQEWQRVKVTAAECPRIPAEFLAEERRALGARWYAQEYECSFEDIIGAVFASEDIAAALAGDVAPLFGE